MSGENHNDNDDVREALDVILPGVNKMLKSKTEPWPLLKIRKLV